MPAPSPDLLDQRKGKDRSQNTDVLLVPWLNEQLGEHGEDLEALSGTGLVGARHNDAEVVALDTVVGRKLENHGLVATHMQRLDNKFDSGHR